MDIIEEKDKEIERLKCDLISSNDKRDDYYQKITVLITSYKKLEKEKDECKSSSDEKLNEYKSEILHLSTEQNLNIEVCVKLMRIIKLKNIHSTLTASALSSLLSSSSSFMML